MLRSAAADPVQVPVDRVGGDQLVDAGDMVRVSLDQLQGVFVHRRLAWIGPGVPHPVREHGLHIGTALVGLEEYLEGALTGLGAGSHG